MILKIPVLGERKLITIEQTTTAEMKCGRKVAVCVSLLTNLFFISVIAIAKTIGTGKQIGICQRASMIVFFIVLRKSGPVTNSLKLAKPTKSDPPMPLKIL